MPVLSNCPRRKSADYRMHIYCNCVKKSYLCIYKTAKIDVFTHGHLAKNGICERRISFCSAWPLNIGLVRCPGTFAYIYQSTLRNIQEE